MTDALRDAQADAFIDHVGKIGMRRVWRSAFAMWAAAKGVTPEDFPALELLVAARLEPSELPMPRAIPRGMMS